MCGSFSPFLLSHAHISALQHSESLFAVLYLSVLSSATTKTVNHDDFSEIYLIPT